MTPQPPNTTFSPGWSDFSKDWFSARIPQWQTMVAPHLKDKEVLGLEIGSYEGRSAIWTLQNMLTHPAARLICVDIWTNQDVEKAFDRNMVATDNSHRIIKMKGDAQRVLKTLTQLFDFAYVDADHVARSVVAQISIIWPLLKKGAFVVFDDYEWKHPPETAHELPPKPGIDAFLALWQPQYELVHKGYQVIVRKL